MSDVLGFGDTPEDYASSVHDTDRLKQRHVRDCMAEHGFDYVVHVVAGSTDGPFGLPTGLSDEEFKRRHGYGIATGFESALSREPGSHHPAEDPNVAIRQALSVSDRGLYDGALHGDGASGREAQGCEGQALQATDRSARLIQAFGDELGELWLRVDSDPRVAGALEQWRECMGQAGYSYEDEAAVVDEVVERLSPIASEVTGEDLQDGIILVEFGASLTADQRHALDEVIAFEIAVATADLECREGLDRVRSDVRDEHEAEFVNENRARLRELFPDADL